MSPVSQTPQHSSANEAPLTKGVSVAMACYNGQKYLPEMLDSILSQTVLPAEIVCSDDCSTDNTVAILERYAANSPVPIRILRQAENRGYRENFYRAFEACTSEYVAYCDQDDFWLPNKLEMAVTTLARKGAAMFLHTSILTDENLVDTGQIFRPRSKPEHYAFPFAAARTHGAGHQMVFSRTTRDMVLELGRDLEFQRLQLSKLLDDMLLFAASLVGSIWVTTEALVKFRRHGNTVSRREKSAPASGLTDRVSRRASSAEKQLRLANDACQAFAQCQFVAATDPSASKKACLAFRDLARARADFFQRPSVIGRCLQFPAVGYNTLKVRMDWRELVRDAAALFVPPTSIEARSA